MFQIRSEQMARMLKNNIALSGVHTNGRVCVMPIIKNVKYNE